MYTFIVYPPAAEVPRVCAQHHQLACETTMETSYRNKTLQIILLGGMAWFMLVVFSNHAFLSQQYISSNNADKLSVPLPPSTDGLIRKESATGGSSLPPHPPDPVKQMLGKSDNNLQLIQPKYCDNEKKYIENCNPTPTNCTKQITKVFSTHGIGNALMISYYKDASPVFESECIPILNDANEGRENGAFKLLDYVQVPNEYVCTKTDVGRAEQQCRSSTIHKKCVIYSISQPLPAVQKTIDTILLPEQQHLPLVAIHVRTGWADEMAVRKHVWDRFVNTSSVCSHEDVINYVHGDDGSGSSNNQTDDHDDDVADSLGKAIYDTGASGIDFSLDGQGSDELRRSLPKDASCLDSKRPVLACLCWIKRAHE